MHVLMAEDDPVIQLVARAALRRAGFEVTMVDNGADAVARAAQAPAPDVVILDWMMPVMDGPEACAQIKANPGTRHIPVIFMTARTHESDIDHSAAVGAAGFITKPFDALALGPQIRALIGQP